MLHPYQGWPDRSTNDLGALLQFTKSFAPDYLLGLSNSGESWKNPGKSPYSSAAQANGPALSLLLVGINGDDGSESRSVGLYYRCEYAPQVLHAAVKCAACGDSEQFHTRGVDGEIERTRAVGIHSIGS